MDRHIFTFFILKALESHLHFLRLPLRNDAVSESSFNVHNPHYFPFHRVLEEILMYTCTIVILSLSVVACCMFKRMMNVYKPTAVGVWPSPSPRTDRPNTPEDIWGDSQPGLWLIHVVVREERGYTLARPAQGYVQRAERLAGQISDKVRKKGICCPFLGIWQVERCWIIPCNSNTSGLL